MLINKKRTILAVLLCLVCIVTVCGGCGKKKKNVPHFSGSVHTPEEEKETLKEENDLSKDMFEFMKNTIGSPVTAVRFTNMLQSHAAALSSEGELSVNMEKALSRMPGAEENEMFKAQLVLEINMNHPIAQKLKELFVVDQDKLAKYSKILYAQARLVSGLELTNASEISDLVVGLMTE